MVKTFVLFTCVNIISLINIDAQNLVPNPSFEEYKKLDCETVHELGLAFDLSAKDLFDSLLYNWTSPTEGVVNFYSTLIDPECYKKDIGHFIGPLATANPVAALGVEPKDGSNFVNISLLAFYSIKANLRSYVQVKFQNPLNQNAKYLAGCYNRFTPYSGEIECNNLGFFFSPQSIASSDGLFLNYQPQIIESEVYRDIDKWQRFSGCFTATGDEQYVTIGNFKSDNDTKTVLLDKNDSGVDFSDRLIDSVFVEEIKEPFIPNVITPNGDVANEKFVIENIRFGWWSLNIFNRWGKEVYHSSDYRNTWGGDKLSEGIYYYELQHRCPGLHYKGTLTIIK